MAKYPPRRPLDTRSPSGSLRGLQPEPSFSSTSSSRGYSGRKPSPGASPRQRFRTVNPLDFAPIPPSTSVRSSPAADNKLSRKKSFGSSPSGSPRPRPRYRTVCAADMGAHASVMSQSSLGEIDTVSNCCFSAVAFGRNTRVSNGAVPTGGAQMGLRTTLSHGVQQACQSTSQVSQEACDRDPYSAIGTASAPAAGLEHMTGEPSAAENFARWGTNQPIENERPELLDSLVAGEPQTLDQPGVADTSQDRSVQVGAVVVTPRPDTFTQEDVHWMDQVGALRASLCALLENPEPEPLPVQEVAVSPELFEGLDSQPHEEECDVETLLSHVELDSHPCEERKQDMRELSVESLVAHIELGPDSCEERKPEMMGPNSYESEYAWRPSIKELEEKRAQEWLLQKSADPNVNQPRASQTAQETQWIQIDARPVLEEREESLDDPPTLRREVLRCDLELVWEHLNPAGRETIGVVELTAHADWIYEQLPEIITQFEDIDRDGDDEIDFQDFLIFFNAEAWLQAELEALAGLTVLKEQVLGVLRSITLDRLQLAEGFNVSSGGKLHMTFSGNPGTGKRSIGHIVAKVLHRIGATQTPVMHEVQGMDLLAGSLEQVSISRTRRVLEMSKHGVLFINEANLLLSDRSDCGSEVIGELLTAMNDPPGYSPVQIYAGSSEQLSWCMHANMGLYRCIPHSLEFQDYSPMELAEILAFYVEQKGFSLEASLEGPAGMIRLGLVLGMYTLPEVRQLMNAGVCEHILSVVMKSSEATTDSFHKVFMESDIARACKKIPMPEGAQESSRTLDPNETAPLSSVSQVALSYVSQVSSDASMMPAGWRRLALRLYALSLPGCVVSAPSSEEEPMIPYVVASLDGGTDGTRQAWISGDVDNRGTHFEVAPADPSVLPIRPQERIMQVAVFGRCSSTDERFLGNTQLDLAAVPPDGFIVDLELCKLNVRIGQVRLELYWELSADAIGSMSIQVGDWETAQIDSILENSLSLHGLSQPVPELYANNEAPAQEAISQGQDMVDLKATCYAVPLEVARQASTGGTGRRPRRSSSRTSTSSSPTSKGRRESMGRTTLFGPIP